MLVELVKELEDVLELPDVEQKEVRTTFTEAAENADSVQLGYNENQVKLAEGYKTGAEEETKRLVPFDKLDTLKKNINKYQRIFTTISESCSGAPIFLILDDFYFVPKTSQPEFVDFFHRLTKGTPLFLKVATIKHRSNLYKAGTTYTGVEINHDVYPIDLDYTLDRLDDLQEFMTNLLKQAVKESGTAISLNDFFTPNGFKQLCIASGGVPRDFLSLFVSLLDRLGTQVLEDDFKKIDKVDVTEAAISLVQGKRDSFSIDSADDRVVLEEYLNQIKDFVYQEKRTNIFLVSKDDLELFKQAKQAIKELVDLRFLHLVERNTSSAPSDGKFYEAYMLDIGLYDNARPRNFNQIEPGVMDDKQRKDNIRACPRINLKGLEEAISRDVPHKLVVTE